MHYIIGYEPISGNVVGSQNILNEHEIELAVSDADWEAWLEVKEHDTTDLHLKQVMNGELVLRVADIEEVREDALAQLSEFVEKARRKYVTKGATQDAIYMRKEAEARRYLALKREPNDLSDFPLIAEEIGLLASTAKEVAELWLAKATESTAALAQIEKLRLSTKREIEAAENIDAIQKAMADLCV